MKNKSIVSGVSHTIFLADSKRPLNPKILRTLEASNDLREGQSDQIGYCHSVWCQTHFPAQSLSENIREWESRNGDAQMRIEAGSIFDQKTRTWILYPVPSGTKARLILLNLCSEAIMRKDPHIPLAKNLNRYIASLIRRNPNSYEMQQFKIQLGALGASRISLTKNDKQVNGVFVREFDLKWLDKKHGKHSWPEYFVLSADFWNDLNDGHAVPVDMKAVKELINIFKGADSNLPHTELLYNLDRLSRTYYSEMRSQERYLLIISDMMEHSALTTFYASGQIRDLNAEKELEKLRSASLSNSFDQTKVYVIGAAYKQKKDYSSGIKIQKLQSFWEAYFNDGAASLIGFGAPTLLTPIQ